MAQMEENNSGMFLVSVAKSVDDFANCAIFTNANSCPFQFFFAPKFLALNFCSSTDYQKLWHDCSLFLLSFDPN